MKKEVTNWKQLSKVMDDSRFNLKPIVIKFCNGYLESLTFETKPKLPKTVSLGKE